MRILLVIPTHQYKPTSPEVSFLSVSDLPQAFPYLSAVLKNAGHEVVGCNPNNQTGYTSGYLMMSSCIRKGLECKPALVGLGGLCTDYHFIKDAIEVIRKAAPLVPIVLGGGIVTHDAEFIMNHLKPDFVVVGEGEKAIVELANMIQSGKMEFEKVDNIGYWEE